VFPTLFRIGPIAIHSYGTLLMVGFIAGILLARREARRLRLPETLPLDLAIWLLVAGVVGARAMYVALNWSDFAARPTEILYIWREGGLSFHGGLLAGVIAGLVFARRTGTPFLALADMTAPSLALGYGIARFGCLLNGCCYGGPTELPWGIRFPLYPDSEIATEPSHPTQIYSALGSFCILGILLWMRPRAPARGQLFLIYLMLYSLLRSGVEVLRQGHTAQEIIHGTGITQAQGASAAIFIIAFAASWYVGLKSAKNGTGGEGRAPP
jgi:phosphatidylglycerol:prolipoprotein diacylglycerol transferase